MAQIIKEISVDVMKKNLFQAIIAKQNDSNSRFLKVTILHEGETLVVEQGSTVIINAARADNESKSFMGTVNEDGTVTVPLTNWMLELDDFVRCDISIIDSKKRKLTSTSFGIEVEAAANSGEISSDDVEIWEAYIGDVVEKELEKIYNVYTGKISGFTWNIDTDEVIDRKGESHGKLSDCMTDDFAGTWFFVKTSTSEAGSGQYPSIYTIDGANGYLSLRDYVLWTGLKLVHISTFEAKASEVINPDGKYSPTGGVDGLMSSTDKAYLGDLVESHWGKSHLPVFYDEAGHLVNWCRDDGWYTGGLRKDCSNHPPVLNDNHTSWAVLVLNSMATDADSMNRNHRLQIAYDLVNSKIYIRRGWMSDNTWANWSDISPEPVSHKEEGLLNWISVDGAHLVAAQAGNGANPVSDAEGLDYKITVGREFDGTNFTNVRFQFAEHINTGRKFYRSGTVKAGESFGEIAWKEINTDIDVNRIKYPGEDGKVLKTEGGKVVWGDEQKPEDDVIIVNGTGEKETVHLTQNTRELVVKGVLNLDVLLPENTYVNWSCILNFSEVTEVRHFDVGFSYGGMFGTDAPWDAPEKGRVYMLKGHKDSNTLPNDFVMYDMRSFIEGIPRIDASQLNSGEHAEKYTISVYSGDYEDAPFQEAIIYSVKTPENPDESVAWDALSYSQTAYSVDGKVYTRYMLTTVEGNNIVSVTEWKELKCHDERLDTHKEATVLDHPDKSVTKEKLSDGINSEIASKADEIINAASGKLVTIRDGADKAIKALTLYGESVQNGTPTPDSPVDVVSVGEGGSVGIFASGNNLFDVSKFTYTSSDINGITFALDGDYIAVSGTSTAVSINEIMLPTVLPKGRYTLSSEVVGDKPTKSTSAIRCTALNGTLISSSVLSLAGGTHVTFEANSIKSVQIRLDSGETVDFKVRIQLRTDSGTASYEDYKARVATATFTEPLRAIPATSGNVTIGGQQYIADTLEVKIDGTGVITRRIGETLIKPTGVRATSGSGMEGVYQLLDSNNSYGDFYIRSVIPNALCTHLQNNGNKNLPSENGITCSGSDNTYSYVRVKLTAESTADDVMNLFNNNDVYIYHILPENLWTAETLTRAEVSALLTLETYKSGTNVHNSDGAYMDATYVADTKNYIDNKFEELKNAILAQGGNV